MTYKSLMLKAVRKATRTLHRRLSTFSSPLRCSVCNQRVLAFTPISPTYSQQWKKFGFIEEEHDFETLNKAGYSCPTCGASDRDRLCAIYLEMRLPPANKGIKFVDFAPSAPLSKKLRQRIGRGYRTADLFMKNVDDCVDITKLDLYANDSIDAFLCSHVLEHVADDFKAMSELHRILKPGGFGLILVPIDLRLAAIIEDADGRRSEAERWRDFAQGDHVRLYSKQGFTGRLREAGFKIEEFNSLSKTPINFDKCGITAKSVLYVASKF